MSRFAALEPRLRHTECAYCFAGKDAVQGEQSGSLRGS